jgi:hypothetical protein
MVGTAGRRRGTGRTPRPEPPEPHRPRPTRMTTEADVAWQHYACACLEHDAAHARRACAELRRLHEIPEQRDAVEPQPTR